MPELPEAELAVRLVRRSLVGPLKVAHENPAIVRGTPLGQAIDGRSIQRVYRHGKHILADLDEGMFAFHLGMSGRLRFRSASNATNAELAQAQPSQDWPVVDWPKHNHVRITAGSGTLLYVDPRKFGRWVAGPAETVRKAAGIDKLGSDVLSFPDGPALQVALRGKAKKDGTYRPCAVAIKPRLMDQKRLAGLGNIQAAEALFRARIHPALRTDQLTEEEFARLHEGIGATIAHTLAETEEEASYLSDGAHIENPFLLYGREGAPCPRCETPIETSKQSGRTTFLCPSCQPLRDAP